IAKDAQSIFDELVRLAALDVRNEADAAGILVERRIVETLRKRSAGIRGRTASGEFCAAFLLAHLILPRRCTPCSSVLITTRPSLAVNASLISKHAHLVTLSAGR